MSSKTVKKFFNIVKWETLGNDTGKLIVGCQAPTAVIAEEKDRSMGIAVSFQFSTEPCHLFSFLDIFGLTSTTWSSGVAV